MLQKASTELVEESIEQFDDLILHLNFDCSCNDILADITASIMVAPSAPIKVAVSMVGWRSGALI